MSPKESRKHTVAVVSASRDGQNLVYLLKYFNICCIRGSSSRRGEKVLHEGVNAIKAGNNVSFTPDGPRGPRYQMSSGPILLASLTKVPLVPFLVNATSYWEVNSWDRFQIPKPWAKLTYEIGEPFTVPPDLEREELEKWRKIAAEKLMEITIDQNSGT